MTRPIGPRDPCDEEVSRSHVIAAARYRRPDARIDCACSAVVEAPIAGIEKAFAKHRSEAKVTRQRSGWTYGALDAEQKRRLNTVKRIKPQSQPRAR